MGNGTVGGRVDRAIHRRGARLGTLVATTIVLVGVVLAGSGMTAWADSGTVRIEPAGNAVITRGPTQVLVESSQPVDAATSNISVYSKDHKAVVTAAPQQAADDPNGLVVAVPDLGKGIYTVVWRLTGVSGASIGAGTSAFQIDPKGASPSIVQQPKAPPASSPARKVSAKWLSFLLIMVFIGALAVRFWVTAPVSRRALGADQDALLDSTDRRPQRCTPRPGSGAPFG